MNDILDTVNNADFNSDFNVAMKMSEESFSYSQLIGFLKDGKDVEKQLAALELNEIKSKEDAYALVSNLVGQDGKIREVVAFKINELVKNTQYRDFFIGEEFFELFLQGIMDINGNICRMVVELTQISEFRLFLAKKLPNCIENILLVIANLEKDEKQYKISKRNFQLYWSLEALFNIIEEVDVLKIKDILLKTAEFEDYTIREKVAKILSKIDNPVLIAAKEKLIQDENYYVRRYL